MSHNFRIAWEKTFGKNASSGKNPRLFHTEV